MKRLAVIGVVLLVLGSSIPVLAYSNEKTPLSTRGNWLYVGGSGQGNYTTIQSALNESNDGDTIYVYNGTYNESFTIYESIHLLGENKSSTIIDAHGSEYGVVLKGNWTTVSGFTVRNSTYWGAGIYINGLYHENRTNNTITNNIVTVPGEALYILGSGNNTITHNLFNASISINSKYNFVSNNVIKSAIGIYTTSPYYNKIFNNLIINGSITLWAGSGNIVMNNTIQNGRSIELIKKTANNIIKNNSLIHSNQILLEYSTDNIVMNNKFLDSRGITVSGSIIDYWNTNTIENNSIDGRPIIFAKNSYSVDIPPDASQAILANCKNSRIQNCTFHDVATAIQLAFCSGIDIQRNLISNTNIALQLQNSPVNDIFYNNISNASIALQLQNSPSTDIYYNNISNNEEALYIIKSDVNTIENNNIANSHYGLVLDDSIDNTVNKNNFIGQSQHHIRYRFGPLPAKNIFYRNYFQDHHSQLPYPIVGSLRTQFTRHTITGYELTIIIPWINVDWFPARKPYDIPMT
jgi:parallel beta-helix repeat protein